MTILQPELPNLSPDNNTNFNNSLPNMENAVNNFIPNQGCPPKLHPIIPYHKK